MATTVVNIHHNKKYDVYIGRPSIWGNPFSVRDSSRADCIRQYREYILANTELLAKIHELRGKTLGCFCKPHACHGDILAILADSCDLN